MIEDKDNMKYAFQDYGLYLEGNVLDVTFISAFRMLIGLSPLKKKKISAQFSFLFSFFY